MTAPDLCPVRRDDDTIARWVAGTLEPDPAATFDEHLLTCATCQEAVEEAATIRAARPEELAAGTRGSPGRRLWWAVPLGLAAAIGFFLFRPGTDHLERLSELGPAPGFEGLPIRAGAGEGAAPRAMRAYQAHDYPTAARLFESALQEEPSTGVRFFLGASLLWSGRAAEAIPALAEVVRDSASPYAPEAGLYLAKAYLRRRNPDSAHSVLERLVQRESPGPIASHARALADSIRQMRVP